MTSKDADRQTAKFAPRPYDLSARHMELKPLGTVTFHWVSCRKGPHCSGVPNEVTLFGFRL